ncbi:hypothetical protein PMIN07_004001 [Paraphaeosphaeria minitans]
MVYLDPLLSRPPTADCRSSSKSEERAKMPKFFCDYCDVYLTHDSMSVRKAHNAGRNHLRNVQAYYERMRALFPVRHRETNDATEISSEQTQLVINSITDAYNAEGQANPMTQNPMGGLGGFPPPGGPGFPPHGFPPPGMPGIPPPFIGRGGLPLSMPPMPFPPPNMPSGGPPGPGGPMPPGGMPFPPPNMAGGPPPNIPFPFLPPGQVGSPQGGMPFPPPGAMPPRGFPPFLPPNAGPPGPPGR